MPSRNPRHVSFSPVSRRYRDPHAGTVRARERVRSDTLERIDHFRKGEARVSRTFLRTLLQRLPT
jgi:hypothetical protein